MTRTFARGLRLAFGAFLAAPGLAALVLNLDAAQAEGGVSTAPTCAPQVKLQVRPTQRVYRLGHAMPVEVLLRNVADTEACVPREMQINGSLHLRLTLDGKLVPYIGRVVRLAQPGVHSFVCLGHQEFIGRRIDISSRSNTGFRIAEAGKYRLQVRFSNKDIEALQARSEKATGPLEAWEDPRCLPAEEGWGSYWRGELTSEIAFSVER